MSRAPKPRWIVRVRELFAGSAEYHGSWSHYGPWVSSAGAEAYAALVRRALLKAETDRVFKVETFRLGNATSAAAVLDDFGLDK